MNQCLYCLADHWPHCPEAVDAPDAPSTPELHPDAIWPAVLASIIKAEIAGEV